MVISHYSELVLDYGSAHKPQQAKLLSYDEIRARAEVNDSVSTERVGPAEVLHTVPTSIIGKVNGEVVRE